MIEIVVHGKSEPAGSKTASPFSATGVRDSNPEAKHYKYHAAEEASKAMAGRPLIWGPLRVSMVFYRPRPKGHYTPKAELNKKGRETPYPTVKPDVLKLARAVEDGLTDVVWKDDAQIVQEYLVKLWGSPQRVEIRIEEI